MRKFNISDWEFGEGNVLTLNDKYESSICTAIKKNKISCLRLSIHAGWKSEDIDFLKELIDLRGIEIYSQKVKDLQVLELLINLEHIGIECGYKTFPNLSNLKKLTSISITSNNKLTIEKLAIPSIKHLNISNYPFENLTPLQKCINLETITLTSNKLSNIISIKHFEKLHSLDIYNSTKIENLNGIEHLKNLRTLTLDSIPQLKDLTLIGQCNNLESLSINNCKDLDSILPLKNCIKLKKLFFGESTNILDGKIKLLRELPSIQKVSFANRRHYDIKRAELQSILRDY